MKSTRKRTTDVSGEGLDYSETSLRVDKGTSGRGDKRVSLQVHKRTREQGDYFVRPIEITSK